MTEPTKRMKERAFQFWGVLAYAASRKQTMTYEELSNATGYAVNSGPVLEIIQAYCEEKKLPPITALVVSVDTDKPLNWDDAQKGDWPTRVEEIFGHTWLREESQGFVEFILPGSG